MPQCDPPPSKKSKTPIIEEECSFLFRHPPSLEVLYLQVKTKSFTTFGHRHHFYSWSTSNPMQLGPHTLYSMMSQNFLCQPGGGALAFFRDLRPREMAACPRLCCQDRLLVLPLLRNAGSITSPSLGFLVWDDKNVSFMSDILLSWLFKPALCGLLDDHLPGRRGHVSDTGVPPSRKV